MPSLNHYLVLSAGLFALGVLGFIPRMGVAMPG